MVAASRKHSQEQFYVQGRQTFKVSHVHPIAFITGSMGFVPETSLPIHDSAPSEDSGARAIPRRQFVREVARLVKQQPHASAWTVEDALVVG